MPRYFEFEVALQDIQPRIWRRFLIPRTSTFAQLHRAIQDSFGWQDCHLWDFRMPSYGGRRLAGLLFDDGFEPPAPDARKVRLDTYFTGDRAVEWCEYVYDYGDDWTHDVKLIAVRSEQQAFKRRLVAGERACPPEDSGGAPGYERIIDFLATGEDPVGEDPEGPAAWLGDWRPGAFDFVRAKKEFDR